MTFLALGDSYTIGESVEESERWPIQLVDSLNKRGISFKKTEIIATTGWRTDDLQSAADAYPEGTFDLVTLLIGVNDQYQDKPIANYPQNFKKLLDTAIERAGGDRNGVFVVSIPDYGYTPFGEADQSKITAELDEYNKINKSVAEEYGIRYFDITDISRKGLDNPDLVTVDGLHPSGLQYSLWVGRMLEDEEWLKSTSSH